MLLLRLPTPPLLHQGHHQCHHHHHPRPRRRHRFLHTSHPLIPAICATTTLASSANFLENSGDDPSLPLHALNPSAIYRRLKLLARHGEIPRALRVLSLLSHRGIPINATTFSHLLRACARSRSLPHARALHTHLPSSSLSHHPYLISLLILVYAACGSPDDAHRFLSLSLSHHPPSSPHPWNNLLRGHLLAGRQWVFSALEAFDEMRLLGVHLDFSSFSSLLEAISISPSPLRAAKAHVLMLKSGFLSPPATTLPTALMTVYFKTRNLTCAAKLFDEISQRDVVFWGVAISGFAYNGMRREALDCARSMSTDGFTPNLVHLITLLPVIGSLSAHRLGREVHGFAVRQFPDYRRSKYLISSLVDMYSKCNDMTSARRVFYASQNRNAVVWTALISGYSSNGRLDQALRSLTWMQKEGIKPDLVSIATALPVCAKLGTVKQGKELHAYFLKRWSLPVSVGTSLMTMYSSCGHLDYSRKLFDAMESMNVITWTAMMDSFLRNGCPLDALGVFRTMQKSRQRSDSVAASRGSRACGELRALRLGKEIHGHVMKRKLEGLSFVTAEIIRMYGRCGEVGLARKVFDGYTSKGPLTWTAMVDAYGHNGFYDEGLELFDRMVDGGFVPNGFTFDAVMSICRRGGLAERAVQLHDLMVRGFKLEASEHHYDSIVELLTLAGRWEEARRFEKLKGLAMR